MTVLEVIQRSTDYLTQRGVESPRLQIELILAHVLQMPRLKLYLEFTRALSELQIADARALVKRRGQREPLQYILGSTSFCGLEMEVNPHVLIPRPETEILAECAWKRLESTATAKPVILDLCAGSGCLGVAIAAHCHKAVIHGVDISGDALDVARRNAKRHGLSERVAFFQGDLFHAVPHGIRYDLIATNPPYIPTNDVATLQPEVREHEPMCALDGGADGLTIIRRIAAEAPEFIAPGGWLLLEFSDGQGDAARELFSRDPWTGVTIEKDFSRRERILIARRQIP